MLSNIKLKLDVKETHRQTSNLNQFQNDRKIKTVRALSLVETFRNIKQQFEIDVDATHQFNNQKYLALCVSVA